MSERMTDERLAKIDGVHRLEVEQNRRKGKTIGDLTDAHQHRAELLQALKAERAEVARLKDGMIEIADALCVPFPDLATKAEIIEQVAHHLDSLATSEAESEIARKAAEAKNDRWQAEMDDANKKVLKMHQKLRAAGELLKAARCPNCDGSGTMLVRGSPEQCQWCDELEALLK